MDELGTRDHDETYAITKNKLEYIKRQRKMEKSSFSNYKSKMTCKT